MLTVLLIPDSALLVPGAAGERCDPLAGARSAAVGALQMVPPGREALVIAPGRADRILCGPYGDGLAAAGIDGLRLPGGARDHPASSGSGAASSIRCAAGRTNGRGGAGGAGPVAGASLPSVGAAAALSLLRLAGHDPDRRATVHEVGPAMMPGSQAGPAMTSAMPGLIVVVGSLSARHGPDAPLADDPAALDADRALLDALATGPAALAQAIGRIGDVTCDRLAITGARPWQMLMAVLADAGSVSCPLPQVRADLLWSGTPGGAQHAVARWELAG